MIRLLDRWRYRKDPEDDFREDYETLIRLARRCAYDLRHTVDMLPDQHFYRKDLKMHERAHWWVTLFAKGNPGKDYRMELQRDIADLTHQLDEVHNWCRERGLEPPDRRDIPW